LEGFHIVRMRGVEHRDIRRQMLRQVGHAGADSLDDAAGEFIAAVIVVMRTILESEIQAR